MIKRLLKQKASTEYRVLFATGLFTLLALAGVYLLIGQLSQIWARDQGAHRVRHVAQHFYGEMIDGLADRLALLSNSPRVRQALAVPDGDGAAGAQSYLDASRLFFGTSVSCLLDARGRVVAVSSNASQERFLHRDCSDRPFFRQAMAGQASIDLGVDPITGERSLYLGHPVRPEPGARPLGVTAVMVDMEALDSPLRPEKIPMVLVSPQGVILASNMPAWLFHTALPLSDAQRAALAESSRFGKGPFLPLGLDLSRPRAFWNGRSRMVVSMTLGHPRGWRLVGLQPYQRPWALTFLSMAALVVIAGLMAWLILAVVRGRRTERARAISEMRFRSTFEQVAVGMAHLSVRGEIIRVNQRARAIWGWDGQSVEGRDFQKMVHHDDLPMLADALGSGADLPGGGRTLEIRVLSSGGGYNWCQLTTSLVKSPLENSAYFLLVVEDISRRRQAEKIAKELARFPDENPNPVLRIDSQGRVVYTNPACVRMLGPDLCRTGEKVPQQIMASLMTPPDGLNHWHLELHEKGRIFNFSVLALQDTGEFYLYGVDVTESHRLRREQYLALQVFENTVEGLIIADQDARVQMVNPAFTAITGYQPEEVLGQRLDVLRAESMPGDFYEELWDELSKNGKWTGEYLNRRKNGEIYPEWLTINILHDEQGRTVNYLAMFYDITEIKQRHETLRYQAHHDALTGLPNRMLMTDRLHQALMHANRHHLRTAVLFIDLDNFKSVNDSLGHDKGDLLLKQVAERLQACVRQEDTVARLGGDEFVVVLRELSREAGAIRVAGKVLQAVADPFDLRGSKAQIGASIGIAFYPEDGANPDELLRAADLAMYRAKGRGRNNFQLFTPTMQRETDTRLAVEAALNQGLERGEFQVHYQPIVDLATRRITGAEALVRWRRSGPELVYPGQFISIAEESGLILPLGRWVLGHAADQAQHWSAMGHQDLVLSVNLSARQFHHHGLVETVEGILARSGLSPQQLELEVQEATLMSNIEDSLHILDELAALGLRLAVDDFGTGYSSLFYLKHLPVNSVKIDKSFIAELETEDSTAAVVSSIVTLSHDLGLSVVAEGVENVRQMDLLRAMGCDRLQGFLFSPSVSEQKFLEMLDQGRRLPRAATGRSQGSVAG